MILLGMLYKKIYTGRKGHFSHMAFLSSFTGIRVDREIS